MEQFALAATAIFAAAASVLSFLTLRRVQASSSVEFEHLVHAELRTSREEAARSARELREEVTTSLGRTSDDLVRNINGLTTHQHAQLEAFAGQLREVGEAQLRAAIALRTSLETTLREHRIDVNDNLEKMRGTVEAGMRNMVAGNTNSAQSLRQEIGAGLKGTSDTLVQTVAKMGEIQTTQLQETSSQVRSLTKSNEARLETIRMTVEDQVKSLAESVHIRLDAARQSVDQRLAQLQQSNEVRLEEMRKTVDEKLHGTLETRLGESFQIVSGSLEAVHRGLGEVHSLAEGVGDLKRVLTNVKVRGTWGEVQLGNILEQILTSDQFSRNVRVREDSEERVEYAVSLPGSERSSSIWLPIDSKFPQESYLRLVDAADRADGEEVKLAAVELTRAIRRFAGDIRDKYISPPRTTDFAVLFLPTESLYAEVLRQPGLIEELQDSARVVVAGPATLAALLSSLRMGFKTLAIEQHTSEVWKILGAVKTEFGKFGETLSKVKKHLRSASRTIDATGVRTRAMERRLRSVEEIPEGRASEVLNLRAAEQWVSEGNAQPSESQEHETGSD